MEGLKKNKLLLWTFGIVFVIFVSYFGITLFNGNSASTQASTTAADDQAVVGSNIQTLLQQLQAASIDSAFFASSAWTSLQNISAPVPGNVPGKSDLFAPISNSILIQHASTTP